jgi:hypothetical protein
VNRPRISCRGGVLILTNQGAIGCSWSVGAGISEMPWSTPLSCIPSRRLRSLLESCELPVFISTKTTSSMCGSSMPLKMRKSIGLPMKRASEAFKSLGKPGRNGATYSEKTPLSIEPESFCERR